MKCAIYCRVSTDDQTTENQKLQLLKMATSRGYELTTIYYENETAWKRGHQAELERCRRDAFNRAFDILMVWDIDRLSRLGPSAMFNIVEGFWNLGLTVVSLQQPWLEVDNMVRPILIAVFASMAKWESDKRSERTKAGLARRKSEKPIKPRGPDKRHRARRADIGKKHRKVKE